MVGTAREFCCSRFKAVLAFTSAAGESSENGEINSSNSDFKFDVLSPYADLNFIVDFIIGRYF